LLGVGRVLKSGTELLDFDQVLCSPIITSGDEHKADVRVWRSGGAIEQQLTIESNGPRVVLTMQTASRQYNAVNGAAAAAVGFKARILFKTG
jgi:hypothetical protein